nr:nitroreductase family protein [Acinetobacter sp.]
MSEFSVEVVHQNIHQRQSIGHLVEPAPNASQLEKAFQAALVAPDHHRLKPTRFVVVPEAEREAFGELLSRALADTGQTEEAQLERVKNHPFRAPLLVLALTKLQDHSKVPHFEQILSSGAAIQNFLLSLQAQGFSTMWRSGAVVESVLFKQALNLNATDLISGIIYIGTAVKAIPPRAEIQTSEFVSEWQK